MLWSTPVCGCGSYSDLSCNARVDSEKRVCDLVICCVTILSLLAQIKIAYTSHSLDVVSPIPCCVVQTGLEGTVSLWLQPLKYRDYRHAALLMSLRIRDTVNAGYRNLLHAELDSQLFFFLLSKRNMLSKVAMKHKAVTAAHCHYQVSYCT